MCCMRDTYRYCIIHMTYAYTLDWLDAQKPRPRPRLLLGLAQTEPFHRSHALLPFKNGLSRTGGLSLSVSFYVQVPKLRSKLSVLAMLNHVRSVWKFENQEISQRLASQSWKLQCGGFRNRDLQPWLKQSSLRGGLPKTGQGLLPPIRCCHKLHHISFSRALRRWARHTGLASLLLFGLGDAFHILWRGTVDSKLRMQ